MIVIVDRSVIDTAFFITCTFGVDSERTKNLKTRSTRRDAVQSDTIQRDAIKSWRPKLGQRYDTTRRDVLSEYCANNENYVVSGE